jgi:hypothetical protein
MTSKFFLKIAILGLLFTGGLSQAAINLQDFHDKNFNPIGGPVGGKYKCGIHLEISGSYVVITNIAPPNQDAHVFCSKIHSGCDGRSYSSRCDSYGNCLSLRDNTTLNLQLLADGNIFFPPSGTKYTRSSESTYEWCVFP